MLHGFGFCADTWIRVIDRLGAEYNVIAPDLLGHGFTDWQGPDSGSAILSMENHIARFMERMGVGSYVAIGSSLGSFIASHLAIRRPNEVRGLVVGALHHPISASGSLNPASLRATMANGSKAMSEATLQACINRIANICFDRSTPGADLALVQTTIYAQPDRLAAYIALGENFIAHVDDPAVRIWPEKIAVPTLFLCGREDIRVDVPLLARDYGRVKNAKLVLFDQCGHLPELEHPLQYVDELKKFLSGR